MEVCRLVTGHKTVEIVMKHYFKPGREHLRAILSDKLPRVLTGHAPAAIDAPIGPLAEIEAKLGELSKTDRRRLTAMLKRST